jgi:transcriptional regulator with XRE-family HTH domain
VTADGRKVEILGRRLRRLRRESKLSPEELAGRIGLDPQDLARIERGEARVGIETLFRLLSEFQIDLRHLASHASDEPEEPIERFRRTLT